MYGDVWRLRVLAVMMGAILVVPEPDASADSTTATDGAITGGALHRAQVVGAQLARQAAGRNR